MKKYSIELGEEQRHALKQILSKGVAPARYDNEYERHGTVSVFVACEPLGGKRIVTVSQTPNQERLGLCACVK